MDGDVLGAGSDCIKAISLGLTRLSFVGEFLDFAFLLL